MITKLWASICVILLFWAANGHTGEKLTIGSSVKDNPFYSLPFLAAEEQEFWKRNGLEVEWVPFAGGPQLFRAMVSGSIDIALSTGTAAIQAITSGVPGLIVAETGRDEWFLWVLENSHIKGAKDLKGAKIGVNRFRSTVDAFARAMAKALGLEKEIRFLAMGGMAEEVAAMKLGKLDARVSSFTSMAHLLFKGEVRPAVNIMEYLPKEWIDQVLVARKDFINTSPTLVKKAVRSFFQATDFIKRNRQWSVDRMKLSFGYSDKAASGVFETIKYLDEGKIERKGVENVLNFLIRYELIPKEKVPFVEQLYTSKFTE